MPEEFFFLLLEMGLGIGYGITPATLNRLVQNNHKINQNKYFLTPFLLLPSQYTSTPTAMQVLQFSVDNKFGHTQKPTDEDGGNFHADHHLLHVKNFGIYNCLTDMYFDTG